MKLSVSAYRAHASAHKKILSSSYQTQHYGSTAASQSHTASGLFSMEPIDPQKLISSTTSTGIATTLSSTTAGHVNISLNDPRSPTETVLSGDVPASSMGTSREDEDSSNQNSSDCKSSGQSFIYRSPSCSSNFERKPTTIKRQRDQYTDIDTLNKINNEIELNNDEEVDGEHKSAPMSWGSLRAVGRFYCQLRKIKRTKSNQRWMKLRTTVQISSAIAPKKPPLKREDSFLKRFSTRQIPETQETVEDTGSEGPDIDKHTRRRKRFMKQPPRSVVNPDENFYFYWLMVLTLCVLYNLWTLIVRQSFPELQENASRFWIACDSLTDVVFVVDVVVQLRTGYLEQGLMVYDSKKLASHYLRSKKFLFDLMSLIPLDILQFRFGPNPLLRFPRFLKVYRVVKYYYIVESRTVWPNLWRVVNLIHILLILAHWFGCFYYLLSEAEGFQGDWVYPFRPGDYATLTRKYLGSLYWSTLTLTTIGDLPTPETNAEPSDSADGPISIPRRGLKSRILQFNSNYGYIFTIVSYLIGVFIFATIVGQVGNVITNRNANRLEFERLLDGAKTYMRHHKVPGGMKRRVLRWYDYSWSRGRIQGGGDINTALGLLPDKLKTELALHVNLSVLKKVTIFQECQPEFLHDLVLKMKAYIFTPGDSICRKGEVAREMFIIADGILEVLSETGRVLTTMKAGDFFGEIGILNLDGLNKRTADVRSVGYSELFSLSREDVLAAMKDYPEAQEILQTLGRKRLMEVRCINKKHAAKRDAALAEAHALQQGQGDSSDNSASKRILDKVKNDVKGLKNVLKKSRGNAHRKSDESIELQPLQGQKSSKGVLRRMQRVKSDDLNADDEECPKDDKKEEKISSPIGAGLPLLQRLRLLKEKQDREERAAKHSTPVVSPPHTHVSSTISPQASIQEEPEPEIIGAGLPLFHRLKLLKAKEEKERHPKDSQSRLSVSSQGSFSRKASLSPTSPTFKKDTATTCELGISRTNLKVSFKDRIKNLQKESTKEEKPGSNESLDIKQHLLPSTSSSLLSSTSTAKPKKPSTTKQLRDKIRSFGHIPKDELTPWSKLKLATVVSLGGSYTSLSNNIAEDSPKLSKTSIKSSMPVNLNSITNKLDESSIPTYKELNLKAEQKTSVSDSELKSDTADAIKRKPKPFKLSEPKNYRSVDDLSPEYSGLPFVKKLKILNERQKLAELESVIQTTRSMSLDCTDSSNSSEMIEILTRSHSEASCMIRPKLNATLSSPIASVAPLPNAHHPSAKSPLSPESNETLERKQLKSILKKLSEDRLSQNVSTLKCGDRQDMKKLMRAQTLEGPPSTTLTEEPEESLKLSPLNSSYPPVFSPSPNQPFKSITTNAQDLSTHTVDNSHHLHQHHHQIHHQNIINTNINISDISTNRFNYSDDAAIVVKPPPSDESTVQKIENVQPPSTLLPPSSRQELYNNYNLSNNINNINTNSTMGTLAFLSDNYAERKLIKGSIEEQEYYSDILLGIKAVIQSHIKGLQDRFQDKYVSLELEVQQRDSVITELQSRLRDYELNSRMTPIRESERDISGSTGSSAELPFMRGDSQDTIFHFASPPSEHEMSERRQKIKRRFSSQQESSRSWDESSDPESFDSVQRISSPPCNSNIVVSNLTGNIVGDSVVVNIEDDSEESTTSNESHTDEEEVEEGIEIEEEEEDLNFHHNDWEVRMLAAELKKRESITEFATESSENDGLLRRRKRRSDTDTDASENENLARSSRPRAASLDQHNLRKQQYKCRGVFKAMSFDRDKDQL
ncbi:uncharacterized protein Cngl isoform X2 [Chironomus tepperi]|uniref:uncharacterized protein Cngl isoform X2 n=1 Tax=Chironomus tepperi TaxID=113505 RepID=UPI00391F0F2B